MSVLILKPPDKERMSAEQLQIMAARIQKLALEHDRITLTLNEGWEVIQCDAPLVRATAKEDGHQIVLEFADEVGR